MISMDKGYTLYQLIPSNDKPVGEQGWNVFQKTYGFEVEVKPEKVILLTGETGAGKTLFLNALVNYLFGVEYADSIRLQLLGDKDELREGQRAGTSMTQSITSYKFFWQPGFPCNYTVTIIDTPGFGDTDGFKKDREIKQQINNFFTLTGFGHPTHLDAICFVAKGTVNRVTDTQKYVWDCFLSVFAKDVQKNICTMLTFCDAREPAILSALREIPPPVPYNPELVFKFNNSGVFEPTNGSEDENIMNELFWKMCMKSHKMFFQKLATLSPQSLVMTKEVLRERRELELIVYDLPHRIASLTQKIQQCEAEKQIIIKHAKDIAENKKFDYQETRQVYEAERLPPGEFITNCTNCNQTCHENCGIKNDEDKAQCSAMDKKTGHCLHCAGKCFWKAHKNMPFKYVAKLITEMKRWENLFEGFNRATSAVEMMRNKFIQLNSEIQLTGAEILKLMARGRECIVRLSQIALQPTFMTTVGYVDLLIMSEERDMRPGWKGRVEQYREARIAAEQTQRINEGGLKLASLQAQLNTQSAINVDQIITAAMSGDTQATTAAVKKNSPATSLWKWIRGEKP